jgi:hypothetical protein
MRCGKSGRTLSVGKVPALCANSGAGIRLPPQGRKGRWQRTRKPRNNQRQGNRKPSGIAGDGAGAARLRSASATRRQRRLVLSDRRGRGVKFLGHFSGGRICSPRSCASSMTLRSDRARTNGRPLLPRSHLRPPCARPRPYDRATCKSRNNQEVACAYQGQRAGRTQIFATIFRPRVCGWIQSVLPVRPISSVGSPSIERGSLELHQAVHHTRPKYLALSRNRGDPSSERRQICDLSHSFHFSSCLLYRPISRRA